MADAASMAEHARGRGFAHPLTREQAMAVCRALNPWPSAGPCS
jgi:hypothetical protein